MKKNLGVLATAGLLMACGSPQTSDAATQNASGASTNQANTSPAGKLYQAAGLQRGMPAATVTAKLKKDGYTLDNHQEKMSFEDGVKAAQAKASGRNFDYSNVTNKPYYQGWKKGGEQIHVFYMPGPGDSLLANFTYEASGGMTSPAEMLATLTKRYGQPNYRAGSRVQWCAKPGSNGCKNNQELMSLEQTTINVNGPTPDDVAMSRVYEAEARKLGGSPKANF